MSPTPSKPSQPPILKVGSKTDPVALAGAVAGLIREHQSAEAQAIGAGAVNQMVKAVAIARGYFASQGHDLAMYPSFLDTEIEGEERTVMRCRITLVASRA